MGEGLSLSNGTCIGLNECLTHTFTFAQNRSHLYNFISFLIFVFYFFLSVFFWSGVVSVVKLCVLCCQSETRGQYQSTVSSLPSSTVSPCVWWRQRALFSSRVCMCVDRDGANAVCPNPPTTLDALSLSLSIGPGPRSTSHGQKLNFLKKFFMSLYFS